MTSVFFICDHPEDIIWRCLVRIVGVGSDLPGAPVTNREVLEYLVFLDLTEEWIANKIVYYPLLTFITASTFMI